VSVAAVLVLGVVAGSAQGSSRTNATLLAAVGPQAKISLKTESGAAVRTIRAGTYTIRVRDQSKVNNFHLMGPAGTVDKRTGKAWRGTATWQVTLVPATYRYASDSRPRGLRATFSVR
jgi:hypothetical protein